jgi:hypothetical protein
MTAVLALAMLAPPAAEAQSRHKPIIGDTKVEALLRDYADPIFRAPGWLRADDLIAYKPPSESIN